MEYNWRRHYRFIYLFFIDLLCIFSFDFDFSLYNIQLIEKYYMLTHS